MPWSARTKISRVGYARTYARQVGPTLPTYLRTSWSQELASRLGLNPN